ncbi:MFS transporter [Brevundimonas sp. UBA7664]|jgi:MFS family permease|uniref:MFS transporter n=2 Tax=Alphaproteobacteria TaxID=28211 RepID=UPI0003C52F3D|nr:MFS transporter [Brevundimonas sp. UBA7664]EYR78056.1 putative transport protein transmembrane [Shinella sp. DD12]
MSAVPAADGRGGEGEPPRSGAQEPAEEKPAAPPPPPPMAPPRAAAYMIASTLLAMTQGFGLNLVAANIPQLQGPFGATAAEATWLMAAYMAPNASLSLALIKIRNQFGLRPFAELGIAAFLLVSVAHIFITDLQSALVLRFFAGIAAAPLSSLGFLYMLEAFSPARKLTIGISLALTNIGLAAPLTRFISPALIDLGGVRALLRFELALAMLSFAAIYLLPLAPPPRAKVIEKLDIVSYLFIAVGFGSGAVVLVLGRQYWWLEAPWIGTLLVVMVGALTIAAVIELNRERPLIDLRWLFSREMLHFAAVLVLFRLMLAEQTAVAGNFFQITGLQNDQLAGLYGMVALATAAGGLLCAAILKPGREPGIHMVALLLIGAGAFLDSRATNLTRPEQMYVSQAMIAAGGSLFLPPAIASGFTLALRKGPQYILSFIVVFLVTQSLGGLAGSALFGSFITLREKFHSNILAEAMTLADPLVAGRVAQLSAAYGRTIIDPAVLKAEGVALLGQQVTREANVLAHNDAFLVIALLAVGAAAALAIHMLYIRIREASARNGEPAAVEG